MVCIRTVLNLEIETARRYAMSLSLNKYARFLVLSSESFSALGFESLVDNVTHPTEPFVVLLCAWCTCAWQIQGASEERHVCRGEKDRWGRGNLAAKRKACARDCAHTLPTLLCSALALDEAPRPASVHYADLHLGASFARCVSSLYSLCVAV